MQFFAVHVQLLTLCASVKQLMQGLFVFVHSNLSYGVFLWNYWWILWNLHNGWEILGSANILVVVSKACPSFFWKSSCTYNASSIEKRTFSNSISGLFYCCVKTLLVELKKIHRLKKMWLMEENVWNISKIVNFIASYSSIIRIWHLFSDKITFTLAPWLLAAHQLIFVCTLCFEWYLHLFSGQIMKYDQVFFHFLLFIIMISYNFIFYIFDVIGKIYLLVGRTIYIVSL